MPPPSMIIRAATREDTPIIVTFQLRMAVETENIELDENVLKEGISNLFRDPSKGKYFVAEKEKQILGCLMTTFEWSDWRNGNVLWIQSVYVDKKFRGSGVYKEMYEYIKKLVFDDHNLRGIRLYVDQTNQDAQEVYQKLGMNGDHYKVFEWMKK